MQSKQFAVAGIVTGGVVTGLGIVVLLAGLTEAESSDRDPVVGYEDVGQVYPDVDPLPSPTPKLAEDPAERSRTRPGGGSVRDGEGEPYASGEPSPAATDEQGESPGPRMLREREEPAGTGAPEPTPAPTRTAGPEPSAAPTESSEPTPAPTPSESSAPPTEP